MHKDTKHFIDQWDNESKLPGPRSKKYQDIFNDIREHTKDLPDSYTMSQRIWSIKNGNPKCPVCGVETKLTRNIPIRARHCSPQCVGKNGKRLEKSQATSLEKYGTTSPMKNKDVAEKVASQLRGTSKPFRPHYTNKKNTYYSKEWLEDMYYNKKYSVEYICNECGVTNAALYRQFKRFGIELIRSKRSYFEEQIVEFIQNSGIQNIKFNHRDIDGVSEVDIYLPDYNLAIECDGLYWHSYPKKPKNYHQEKKISCMKRGINLVSFFEHEYINNKELVESIISYHLGIGQKKLRASSLDIREVPCNAEREFLNRNHIQGYSPSSVCIGLFLGNSLKYLMSFGKPRFDKNMEWELIRCCGDGGTKVYGGASKIWKHFINTYKPKNVLSYCNLRYGNGGMYDILGFVSDRVTTPSYFYFNPAKLKTSSKRDKIETISRYQAQKKNLPNLLNNFESSETEYENMTNNKYLKIYDAGNIRYLWYTK